MPPLGLASGSSEGQSPRSLSSSEAREWGARGVSPRLIYIPFLGGRGKGMVTTLNQILLQSVIPREFRGLEPTEPVLERSEGTGV